MCINDKDSFFTYYNLLSVISIRRLFDLLYLSKTESVKISEKMHTDGQSVSHVSKKTEGVYSKKEMLFERPRQKVLSKIKSDQEKRRIQCRWDI